MKKTRVFILGQEGYIGTALTKSLNPKEFVVSGIDNNLRQKNVYEIGSDSLTDKEYVGAIGMSIFDTAFKIVLKNFRPDVIVHLAEQPSAPFSMIDAAHAIETQKNNVLGTLNVLWAMREVCPDAHLIKLGTEGEYPDWLWDGKHIPEGGRMEVGYSREEGAKFEKWKIPTPRYAGSFYHWSKVFDSFNIDYACRIWGLTATDVNQGVVYGHLPGTRFDYDEYFGTVVNRFAVQAVAGMPLTVYGTGEQTRGFIALKNSIEAIELLAKNPPAKGEYRVIHQTTKVYSVNDIARMVQEQTGAKIEHIKNPRAEAQKCEFTFENKTLIDLGLKPIAMEDEIKKLIAVVRENEHKINKDVILPKTTWN